MALGEPLAARTAKWTNHPTGEPQDAMPRNGPMGGDHRGGGSDCSRDSSIVGVRHGDHGRGGGLIDRWGGGNGRRTGHTEVAAAEVMVYSKNVILFFIFTNHLHDSVQLLDGYIR